MRVLLATDGSGSAAIAAELVKNIRWPQGSSIDVIRVVGEPSLEGIVGPWPLGLPTPPALEATEVADAEDALLVTVQPLSKLGLKTAHAVLRGRPADAILEWIEGHRPDLVVVGTRADSELTQALVGSVSAELVDRSPVPVLVARRPTLQRVVVAVDGSDIASRAVATVRRWPFLAAATIRVLSVAPAPVFVTLRTGQPKLMSTMSAPAACTIRAASAITAGSEPKIWIASGCSSLATRR